MKFDCQRAVLDKGYVSLEYIPTEEQATEGLTKLLRPSLFIKFCNLIGIGADEHIKKNV